MVVAKVVVEAVLEDGEALQRGLDVGQRVLSRIPRRGGIGLDVGQRGSQVRDRVT
jgi:hypothetical protein